MSDKLRRLRLRCPRCARGGLAFGDGTVTCATCGAAFDRRGSQIVFNPPAADVAPDPLDRLKHRFKGFRPLYAFLIYLISPLYFDSTRRRFLAAHARRSDRVCVNLGSGNTVLDEHVVNVDCAPYAAVDLVCDVSRLPLEDDSVDVLLNVSVLEHVPEPERVIAEARRVLKPGGLIYTDVPFVVGFHASPHDYHRWTDQGVVRLHAGFEQLELLTNGGPTSALLWVLQEWIAILLCFGSRRLHLALYLVAMLVTFPLKFLDAALKHSPLARNISSCFIFIGRKR